MMFSLWTCHHRTSHNFQWLSCCYFLSPTSLFTGHWQYHCKYSWIILLWVHIVCFWLWSIVCGISPSVIEMISKTIFQDEFRRRFLSRISSLISFKTLCKSSSHYWLHICCKHHMLHLCYSAIQGKNST